MFQNDDFIEVRAKSTGEPQMIPRAWLEDSEGLGKDFEPLTPAAELGAKSEGVKDILKAVGEDPEKARTALALEQATPSPRKTLVEALQAVLDAHPADGQ